MKTYEVTFIEKKKFTIRVEANDVPEAVVEAVDKVQRGAEGMIEQHTLDVHDTIETIIA